jgi:hypothetical protein
MLAKIRDPKIKIDSTHQSVSVAKCSQFTTLEMKISTILRIKETIGAIRCRGGDIIRAIFKQAYQPKVCDPCYQIVIEILVCKSSGVEISSAFTPPPIACKLMNAGTQ